MSDVAINRLFYLAPVLLTLIFFDYLYYSLYRFYSEYNEKGASSTSAGIVGGIQALNLLTLIFLFQLLFREKNHIDKLVAIGLFGVFQILTYYRYIYKGNHSTDVMEKKWSNKSAAFRKQMSTFLFLYVAISIIGCFGLAIYVGSKN